MQVRVFIHRKIIPGKEDQAHELLRKLRALAQQHPGYQGGELLSDPDSPQTMITTAIWQDADAWADWAKSPGRLEIESQLRTLLQEASRVRIFGREEVAGA